MGPDAWEALLRPEGIAVIGVSRRQRYGRTLIENLIANGYPADRIHPVNPRYETFLDLPCHASVTDIASPVSLAILLVRHDLVPELITEAAEVEGLAAAIVVADGYAESGVAGRERQEQLAQLSRELGIALLGPNTLGLVSTQGSCAAWAGSDLSKVPTGGVGLVFQSSGMLNLVLGLVAGRAIGVSTAVSVGNEAIIDIADFIDQLVIDERTSVITMMMESCLRPRAVVEALARARDAGKPVVMLKVGMSERAQRNAVAHTGRLAGSGDAWEALLRQLGVVLVEDIDELLLSASLFSRRVIRDLVPSIGFATISGGDASLLGDLAQRLELPLPESSPDVLARMIDRIGKATLVGNPLDCQDLHRQDPEAFGDLIDAFCADPRIGVVAYRFNLAAQPTDALVDLYTGLRDAARRHGKMPVFLSRAGEFLDPAWFALFEAMDVAFLPAFRPALSVLGKYCRWLEEGRGMGGPFTGVPDRPRTVDPSEIDSLSWADTQAFLGRAGVPYARAALAADGEDAASAAQELGFPVAVKIVARALAHKSDIGGVRLGVGSAAEVRAVCADFERLVAAQGLEIEGYEVQAMAPEGVELLLGAMRDDTLGPVVLIGMGGVLAEVMRDTRVLIPPVDARAAEDAIRSLRGAALLDGTRGRPAVDVSALAETVASLSMALLEDHVEVHELDLNPLIALYGGDGVVAVDAVVRAAQRDQSAEASSREA